MESVQILWIETVRRGRNGESGYQGSSKNMEAEGVRRICEMLKKLESFWNFELFD